MLRPLALAALFALTPAALAPAAAAQGNTPQRIAAGETVQGTLSPADPLLEDDTPYDLFVYRGTPGETVVFTLRSADFDAFLAVGVQPGARMAAQLTDDDSAGGTDSEVTMEMAGGDVILRANCISPGESGRYTLTARSLGGSTAPAGSTLRDGDVARGTLDASDTELPDGSFVDTYTYQGAPGDAVTVTLRSSDFDAYLSVGTMSGGRFVPADADDDSGGGTDAQLQTTAGPDGTLAIRANSLRAGETGSYQLSVQRTGGLAADAATPLDGRTSGRLAAGDARLSDNSFYDLYVYRGAPGEAIEITMSSADFDTYLGGGTTQDAAVRGVDGDDDGGGGTDSQLRVVTGSDGAYYVRANSLLGDQTGAYTLAVRTVGGGGNETGLPMLTLGAPVSGRLDASDGTLDDGSYYDAYAYDGTAGEEVVISLSSDDFDAFALLNRVFAGELEAVVNDDDGGAGTDARIRTTLAQTGTYVIVANTFGPDATGAYTLSIERPGADGGTAELAYPSLRTGQPATGELAAGDAQLNDDSFVDLYVYRGVPGERVTATLRSSDFNAYLLVATVEAGDLTTLGQDDDGAGDQDARVTFTVGGDGVYVVQANSYSAGETGAYTLVVERAGGVATPADRPVGSRFVGKWAPATYTQTSALADVRTAVQRSRRLETIVETLNADYPLPRNVPVSFDECGYANAGYTYWFAGPREGDGEISFCYEMMTEIADVLGRTVPAERLPEAVSGAYEFIMLHEVGHALRHQLDLPITGLEEDMADQFATLTLIRQGDKGAQAAVDGVLALQEDRAFGESDYADEHSLGPQRYYNVACWVYGSNPAKYSNLVGEGGLPEARAERCTHEFAQLEKSFERLLGSAYAE